MLKVAILDDYQNVSQQFVDIEKLSGNYEIKFSLINYKISNLFHNLLIHI